MRTSDVAVRVKRDTEHDSANYENRCDDSFRYVCLLEVVIHWVVLAEPHILNK